MPSKCSPASVSKGTTTNVTLIGLSDGDAGFFDPGSGFSNRIAAAVNGGGVTINSITYNNPTNLTLNILVASGATPGARTITVTNPDGQSASSPTAVLSILSNGSTNISPVLGAIGDETIFETTTLTFTNTATDANGDTLTFSLDTNNLPVGAEMNPTNGVLTWTPTEVQGPGTNSFTVRVTDNGSPPLSDSETFTVVVLESNSPPVLAPIATRTIHAGTTLLITNSATDSDIPANTLAFSLDSGAPGTSSIDPVTGLFSWTPDNTYTFTTNAITVRVTDDGTTPKSDAKTFDVIVVVAPTIENISISSNIATMTWSAIAGQSYRLQYKSEPGGTNWNDILPDVTASSSTASKTDPLNSIPQRYYRILVR
jgi:hypothetical protein